MGIIGNIENNIVVIYEIKSFYVTLAVRNFFPNNMYEANYHFTHSKKLIILRTTVGWYSSKIVIVH
jgi:hypothetical protein